MQRRLTWTAAVLAVVLVACSSSSSSTPANIDAKDASSGDPSDNQDGGATQPSNDGGPSGNAHVGDSCKTSKDCAGLVDPVCLGAKDDVDSVNPTAVCTGACDTEEAPCDDGKGFCTQGRCLPACEASSTAVTKACRGKNSCNIHPNAASADVAPGFCLAGCRADADCESGDRCQVQSGACVKTLVPMTAAGAPCHEDDEGCITPEGKTGYFSPFCIVGDDTCPSGFTCNIPYTVDSFNGNPTGVAGRCWKTCSTPAQCPVAGETLAGWACQEIAGHAKVCIPAP